MLRHTLFSLFIVLAATCVGADKRGESLFDRWDLQDRKNIEIHLNFDTVEAHRLTESEFRGKVVDGSMTYEMDVAVRGRYRRRTCALPPLKLQFDKDLLRLAGLNTHNDYKLVTHCTADEAGQEALLREQLAYELYRTLRPEASYRTQLLTVTYVDTANDTSFRSYAILIEDTDELKGRLAADNVSELYNLPLEHYANAEELTLFQYMIGNADYSTRMVRNLKLLRDATGKVTAIPYDFDFCGLVDAPYAVTTRPEQETVRDRVLLWEFTDRPDLKSARKAYLPYRDAFLVQIEEFDQLSDRSRREISRYVKVFFRQLKSGQISL
jgi:hypothetical protein